MARRPRGAAGTMMVMRSMLPVLGLVLLIGAACRGDGDVALGPTATSTPATTVTAATVPAATPAASATRTGAAPAITAANAGTLQSVVSVTATDNVQRLVWANDGRLLLVDANGVVAVDPSTGATKRLLDLVDVRVLAVGSTVAGDLAALAGRDSPVRLVGLAGEQVVQSLDPGGITTAAMFFKGNRVALVAADRIGVSLWDTGNGQRVGELTGFQTAAPVYNVAISNDGARVAWVARGTLQFSELASGVMGARLQFEDFIGAYAFAPDGRTFATATAVEVGGVLQGRVQLWDPATGVEVLRIASPVLPSTLAYSNVQPLLATAGEGFALWSTADGRQLAAVPQATAGRVRLVSFSPDGATLATVADDGTVRFWRPAP